MQQLIVTANKLNKRSSIPQTLPDLNGIIGTVNKGYTFIGDEVSEVANIALGKWYKDRDDNYYWGGAVTAVSNVPITNQFQHLDFTHLELPLTKNGCIKCFLWMDKNWKNKFIAATANTPFDYKILYAIACQETAIYWQAWIDLHTPEEILGRCVFDASGDVNGTRSAFPKNTQAFIDKYGQQIADELIDEANKTRAWRGFSPKQWVYAGYGIFQYDLQSILVDNDFFINKKWYLIDECLTKVINELNSKWAAHPDDLFNTIKAYNGSGAKAESYALNVFQFWEWIKAV